MIKKLFKILIICGLAALLCVLLSDYLISREAKNCYNSISEVSPAKVGLVLGTSKYVRSGNVNQYYQYRLNATKQLYDAQKIKYVLVSGDNSTTSYDEPNTFKRDLIKMGIPAEKIILDYAGFRTLDSVVRAKEVFQENNFILISQPFHNERALFIASRKGINAKGYNAKDVTYRYGFKTQLREKFARVKTCIDLFILNTQPKFLGDKITIG
ncbi:MAG: vancomycin high temperature exclusion protein [Flavobacteriales bacterium]